MFARKSKELIEFVAFYALFVGLDMADLAAVGAFARRPRSLLNCRFGRAFSAVFGTEMAVAFLEYLLLFLALESALLVLFQTILFLFHAESNSLVTAGAGKGYRFTYSSRKYRSFSPSPVGL